MNKFSRTTLPALAILATLTGCRHAEQEFPTQVDLQFTHLTAYGRITLKNLDLGDAKVEKVDLVFDTPVVGEWYWGEDGTLTSNGASHTITLNTDASGDL